MFKLKNGMMPKVFEHQFSTITHKYNTRYKTNNFVIPKTKLRLTDFSITCRGPRLWNSLLTPNLKTIKSFSPFKYSLKRLLLNTDDNEKKYF